MMSCHVELVELRTLLGIIEKTDVVAASIYNPYASDIKERIPDTAGSCSTRTSRPTCETRKKGQQFTLLRRITRLKLSIQKSIYCPQLAWKGFPRRAHTTLTEPA